MSNVVEKKNLFYHNCVITTKMRVPFVSMGNNIKEILEKQISEQVEGICIKEGYVKSGSVKVNTYSAGECHSDEIEFTVVYSCLVCCPVEGMIITVEVTNITKAGIRARSRERVSPVDVFVARDHNIMKPMYSEIKEGDHIQVEIIGQRYELYDKTISVIADLSTQINASRPRIVMKRSTPGLEDDKSVKNIVENNINQEEIS
jgi:DNA-directed RNA polymerase subunit E'/Rpb7